MIRKTNEYKKCASRGINQLIAEMHHLTECIMEDKQKKKEEFAKVFYWQDNALVLFYCLFIQLNYIEYLVFLLIKENLSI